MGDAGSERMTTTNLQTNQQTGRVAREREPVRGKLSNRNMKAEVQEITQLKLHTVEVLQRKMRRTSEDSVAMVVIVNHFGGNNNTGTCEGESESH